MSSCVSDGLQLSLDFYERYLFLPKLQEYDSNFTSVNI